MKVTRLAKDRYILAIDSPITSERVEQLQAYWKDWWDSAPEPGKTIILGGEEVEFVDFISTEERLDDIDAKLNKLLEMLS